MNRTSSLFTFLMIIFSSNISFAQFPGGGGGGGQQNMNMGHFYGKLVDITSNKAVEGATVQLIQNKLDTATKKKKDVIIAFSLSDKKGEFSIEQLPVMATFVLRISAIGFKPYEQKVSFQLNMNAAKNGDFSSMLNGVDKDLGNIKLTQDVQQLQNITVSASKPLLQLNLDKKVYNVEKDISAAGGTAVDVMKNVPSVNVDIDGNVTMRNAAPQIFVDGRPSTLSLDQIPADQIASIEIITNPSAKFDASGGGSGILNIVLKKNRKSGYNGNLRASIDSRGRPGFGGDVNIKQQKVNIFAAGMLGMRKSISTVNTLRSDFLPDTIANLAQNNDPVGKGYFAFARLGLDYFIDNRNTISISGNMVRGEFKNRDLINIFRDTIIPQQVTVAESGVRNVSAVSAFRNYGGTLGFKHNFAKAGKELTADINYNQSKNNNTSDYDGQYFDENGIAKSAVIYERSVGNGTTKNITLQTDFVNPISTSKKIEMGLRMAQRDFATTNLNYFGNASGNYFPIAALDVNYNFTDIVYAAYGTYSQQIKDFSFQLGTRVESSNYKGNLINKNQKFSTQYPFSFFPSAYFTYKLSKKEDVQLNYSRKINRPNFFQLIPFIDFSDSLNLSIGNPALVPEFTNLVEIAYTNQYKTGNSILLSLYGRNTNDLITRYQFIDSLNYGKPVRFITYANASRSYTIGLELTAKNKLYKWWDLTTNINVFDATIKASNLAGTGDNNQFSWFVKLNNSFKLPKNFSIQLTADYQAKTLLPASSAGNRGGGGGGMFGGGGGFGQVQTTAQGYIKPVYGADFSIKKDFLKNNAASLTLQISDIFRSRVYATHAENMAFIQDNKRRRDPQVVRLNFNWRFGKFDVALFKRKNMKGEMESMQGMQQSGAQ